MTKFTVAIMSTTIATARTFPLAPSGNAVMAYLPS
jgi:hypothetical protein